MADTREDGFWPSGGRGWREDEDNKTRGLMMLRVDQSIAATPTPTREAAHHKKELYDHWVRRRDLQESRDVEVKGTVIVRSAEFGSSCFDGFGECCARGGECAFVALPPGVVHGCRHGCWS